MQDVTGMAILPLLWTDTPLTACYQVGQVHHLADGLFYHGVGFHPKLVKALELRWGSTISGSFLN